MRGLFVPLAALLASVVVLLTGHGLQLTTQTAIEMTQPDVSEPVTPDDTDVN